MDFVQLERGLLRRALADDVVMAHAVSRLGGYKFGEPELTWIWQIAKKTYEETGEAPTKLLLQAEILKLPDENQVPLLEQLVAVYRSPAEQRPRATILMLIKRARTQAAIDAMERASERLAKGDDDGAVHVLESGLASREARPGLQAKVMFPKTLAAVRTPPRIRTSLYALDQKIGGLQRKEFGLIMGTTGMGKSALTVTLGHACIKQGLKLLHIDTENGEEITRARYISRFTQVPAALIEENTMGPESTARVERWLKRNHERMAAHFRVIYPGFVENTLEEVEAAIKEQIGSGFIPDLVIFDSPDHLLMENGEARWERFADTYNRIKGLAGRLNIALWGTSQADLAYEGKIAGNAAVADSKQKPRNASLVLSVNPLLDKSGKPVGGDRKCIHIAKARNRPSRITIPLQTNLAIMKVEARPDFDQEEDPVAESGRV
jgi:hypothetical protein